MREELDVTSPKDGCSPSGQCGCCTVLIDGKASVSCQISLEKVAGKSITTLEGFDGGERERFAAAFAAAGALQCGFCTPGILVRVKALIDKKGSALTREEAARFLGAHLCRCTGYSKILDAVEVLASGESPPASPPGGVGTRGARYEGTELALGDRDYVDDIRVSGHAAWGAAARGSRQSRRGSGSTRPPQPPLRRVWKPCSPLPTCRVICGSGSSTPTGRCSSPKVAGRPIWATFSRSSSPTRKQTAREAAKLVEVSYKPLRPLTDALAALEDQEDAVWQLEGNVLARKGYRRGDADAALALRPIRCTRSSRPNGSSTPS